MLLDLTIRRNTVGDIDVLGVPEGFTLMQMDIDELECELRFAILDRTRVAPWFSQWKRDPVARIDSGAVLIKGYVKTFKHESGFHGDFVNLTVVEES